MCVCVCVCVHVCVGEGEGVIKSKSTPMHLLNANLCAAKCILGIAMYATVHTHGSHSILQYSYVDTHAAARASWYVYLRIGLVVRLLRPDPFADQLVSNGVRHGLVEVPLGGYVPVLHQRVVQVAVEAVLHCRHVLQPGQVPHGDLLLAEAGAPRGVRHLRPDRSSRHGCWQFESVVAESSLLPLCTCVHPHWFGAL